MASIRFRKPKIAVLMSEIISLTIWLFLGDRIISTLNGIIGSEQSVNFTDGASAPGNTALEGCDNASIFEDAYEILGIGYSCEDAAALGTSSLTDFANSNDGLLGVIGLVMVVMVLMNFVTYN